MLLVNIICKETEIGFVALPPFLPLPNSISNVVREVRIQTKGRLLHYLRFYFICATPELSSREIINKGKYRKDLRSKLRQV